MNDRPVRLDADNSVGVPGLGRRRLIGIAFLLITILGWAANWSLVKVLLRVWPPLFSRGLAGIVAAIGLMLIAAAQGHRLLPPRRTWPRLACASFTNVFAWMGFSTLAMKWVSVAEGALLVYTMPIWVVFLAWPIRGARPTALGFVALVLGLSGVAVLLGGQGVSLAGDQAFGAGLALAAAVCFALGTIVNGAPLPLPPLVATAWQVGLGCLPMLVLGIAIEHPRIDAMSPHELPSFIYMTVVSMAVCYLTWFAALRRLPASLAAMGMLLVPVASVLLAAPMIGEPLGIREGVSMLLTLGGVALVLARP